jgi:phospholipid-transporting ATPase
VERTKNFLDAFSKEGLRTLVIAEKEVSPDFYNQWNKQYQAALVTTNNREEQVNQVAELIERDFDLVGTTAIEDKLQEDVGDTLKFIKAAGIKVWVLTGDKIETAINIGISCELLNIEMETFIIEAQRTKEIMSQITQARRMQKMTELARDNAVIVAGDSLLKITKNERCQEEFLELAQAAKVVIACRVSPK